MASPGTSSRRRRARPAAAGLTPTSFRDAVVEGLHLLNQSRSAAQRLVRDAFENAQETVQTRVGGAREQAQETWDNLEALFQQRVQRAMHQLGVPTAEEIRLLAQRVEELNESVRRLGASGSLSGRTGAGTKGAQRRVPGAKRRVTSPRARKTSARPRR